MDRIETIRAVQTDLQQHPAVRAWRELKPLSVAPGRIEILKGKSPQQTRPFKRLVCRLVGVGLAGSAVIGKRCRRSSAVIENAIYEEILPHLPIPSLNYYGMVEEASGEFCWLFLEDAGEKAYSDLIEKHRALSTQWLSLMHTSAAHLTAPTCLPDKGPNHYLKRLQFARHAILEKLGSLALPGDDLAPLNAILRQFDLLESYWDEVRAFCRAIPQTLVHGDFVAKNLRIQNGQTGMTLLPFDWGESGWGTPAVDIRYVDVTHYWSMVRGHWPWLSVQAIQQLVIAGMIFRYIDAIYWEIPSLNCDWLKKSRHNMIVYTSRLGDAIRAARLRD